MKQYNLEEAAQFLGLKPTSLVVYVNSGRIPADRKSKDDYSFKKNVLKAYLKDHRMGRDTENRKITQEQRARNFDRIHGKGSYQKLLELFEEPCKSYREIADKFGVTGESVRQLHDRIFPEKTGKGRERRHTRAVSSHRQKLFSNEMFKPFYRIARTYFSPDSIEPIQRNDPPSFRTHAVKLNGKKVLLRKATRHAVLDTSRGKAYGIKPPVEESDFIFYLSDNSAFWFIPRTALKTRYITLIDSEASRYHGFRNNFGVLLNPRD